MKTSVRVVGLLFFLLFCSDVVVPQVERTTQKNGRLVVIVVIGDDYTRAHNVFIYAHGYLPDGYPGETSLALKETQAGWYEASLAPGLYDVFVSEGTSLPRCTRVEIKADKMKFWSLKLETDDDHLTDSVEKPGGPAHP
jgi:hypothetical protein